MTNNECSEQTEMENHSMDHYEKQLYAVFKTFDYANTGCLDKDSLMSLCNTLQLEEKGCRLVDSLINVENKEVTFTQFRDGLLTILGDVTDKCNDCQSEDESSGREISPKFVYGSKKYGRRSRPQDNIETPTSDVHDDSDLEQSANYSERGNKVQRSVSNCDVNKERKVNSNSKLKRCISFPGNQRINESQVEKVPEIDNYIHLGLDHSSLISFNEAVTLCHDMQMENADTDMIKQIFDDQCDSESVGHITVGEFFHQLNKRLITSITPDSAQVITKLSSQLVCNGDTIGGSIRYPMLISDKINSVKTDVIVEMWEQAGIQHCQQMLYDLGFNDGDIDMVELLNVLDEEIKIAISSINKSTEFNSASMLLQASLCVNQYELKTIKNAMEQIFGENYKLKADLLDANQRAQVLAQEVDENHTKMESSLRTQIKQLELKHSEIVKDMSSHMASEKEQLSTTILQLEEKIEHFNLENSKLKQQLGLITIKNEELEKHVLSCQEHISELEKIKIQLTKEVKKLVSEKNASSEKLEPDCNETDVLLGQISKLQLENKSLRDRNDELCAEIETLQDKLSGSSRRLSLTKTKTVCDVDISSEQAIWSPDSDVDSTDHAPLNCILELRCSSATKRRGDSPSKGSNCLFEEESPRIGKLRKCHKKKQTSSNASDINSGTIVQGDNEVYFDVYNDRKVETTNNLAIGTTDDDDTELFHSDQNVAFSDGQSLSKMLDNKDNVNIRDAISDLMSNIIKMREKVEITQNESDHSCDTCCKLKDNFQGLEKSVNSIEILLGNDLLNENINLSTIRTLSVNNDENLLMIQNLKKEIEDTKQKHEAEMSKMSQECRDLEYSVEQLKMEYDKCEDYWTGKLDEERAIFDQEQQLFDDKLGDLLSKVSEYEEQFASHNKKNASSALPPIEEKYSLEQQFTDLEEEFEEYKIKQAEEMNEKLNEVKSLKEQIEHLEKIKISVLSDNFEEAKETNVNIPSNKRNAIQVECLSPKIVETKVEQVGHVQPANSPIGYLWTQSTIKSPVIIKQESVDKRSVRDYHNPAYVPPTVNSSQQSKSETSNCCSCCGSNVKAEKSTINPIKRPATPKRNNDCHQNVMHFASPMLDKNIWAPNKTFGSPSGMIQCSDLETQLRGAHNPQVIQNMNRGWSENVGVNKNAEMACILLEQRCQQLQSTLRTYQSYLEAIQFNSRQESDMLRQKLFTAEAAITKLQQRLTSADLLVKELYVENCQLTTLSNASNSMFKPKIL